MPNYMVSSGGRKFKVTMAQPPTQTQIEEMLGNKQGSNDSLDLESLNNSSTQESLIETLRPITKQMESGGRYDIYHPKTKSGKQALGAYGIVPDFWFERFPELGLKVDSSSKEKFLKSPKLQDDLFTKVMQQGIKEVGEDPIKLRAWYYGGPNAVKNLERGTGHKKQVAYDDSGKEISMPSHAADSEIFKDLLPEELSEELNTPALDTRALAGLPPLRYPNREAYDPANVLFDNPEAQSEAVRQGKEDAIRSLPIREQMGSGVGAFAYKFPGMGMLSELAGLAPKGSAKNKKEEVEAYNETRTPAQFAGELIPDITISALGGTGLSRAANLSKLDKLRYGKDLRRVSEGLITGGTSGTVHQLQNLGSGKDLNKTEFALEASISAALPYVGGKLGDAVKAVAPKTLKTIVKPLGGANEKVYENALEEDVVPIFGGLKGTQSKVDKTLANLESLQSSEALKASKRTVLTSKKEPTLPPAATPKAVPVPTPTISDLAEPIKDPTFLIKGKPANHPTNKDFIGPPFKAKPKSKTIPKEDTEALAKADREAAERDLARRKAEAEARRTNKGNEEITLYRGLGQPHSGKFKSGDMFSDDPNIASGYSYADAGMEGANVVPVKVPKPDVIVDLQGKFPGEDFRTYYKNKYPNAKVIKFTNVKDLFSKEPQNQYLVLDEKLIKHKYDGPELKIKKEKPKPTPQEKRKEHFQELADEGAIKEALEAEKALRVQRKLKGQRGAITNPFFKDDKPINLSDLGSDLSNKEKLSKLTRKQIEAMNEGIKEPSERFKNQRGSITNPFYKDKTVSTVESRKIGFVSGPLARAKRALEDELTTPSKRTLTATEYDKAKQTLDLWEAEAKARPTTKGGPQSQMTVEDALAFTKAIKNKLGKGDNGANRATKLILDELESEIKKHAPKVAEASEKIEKITPFKKALDTRANREGTKIPIPMLINLASLALGAGSGAASSSKGKKLEGAIFGAGSGFLLSKLATSPGGAALLYKTGKALGDRTNVKTNSLAQLQRSLAIKSREKK